MYSVGTEIICIDIDNSCNNLITVGKRYKVLEYKGIQFKNTVNIMTNVGVICTIPLRHFTTLSELRKSKLKKLNNICSKQEIKWLL